MVIPVCVQKCECRETIKKTYDAGCPRKEM